MKLIVFGRDVVVQRIKAVLYDSGIEVSTTSWDKLNSQENTKEINLAMIDMAYENAENACRVIRENYKIPLVLIVKHQQVNWSYLDSLHALGYISDTFSKIELIARLEAIFRRFRKDLSKTIQTS